MKQASYLLHIRTFPLALFFVILLLSFQNSHAASVDDIKGLKYANNLITHLSRERDMTAMLVVDTAGGIKRSLMTQRTYVDTAADEYGTFLKTQNSPYVSTLEKSMHGIKILRQSIDKQETSSLSDYDAFEMQLVGQIAPLEHSAAPQLRPYVKVYVALLKAKAATDRLRCTITPKLATRKAIDPETVHEIQTLIQQSKIPDYADLNDKNTKARLDDLFLSEDVKECMEDMALELEKIMKAAKSANYEINPTVFFSLLTEHSNTFWQAMTLLLEPIDAYNDSHAGI